MSGNTKKATKAASAADILKHAGGSESDAWNDARVATDLTAVTFVLRLRSTMSPERKDDKNDRHCTI